LTCLNRHGCCIFERMKKDASEYSRLVRMFCTPPPYPLSEGEMNALKKADTFTVRFEDWDLPCYSWGEGKTVLLCHGWGSRAGHLVLMAKVLARAGYKVVAFDAPAHYSRPGVQRKAGSTMFEFGQAVSLVARSLGDVYGLIGHSLGAMASLFAMAAYPHLEENSFFCKKLILVSTPAKLHHVIGNFCRRNSLNESDRRILESELQAAFAMTIADYDCARALKAVSSKILIIQDADDEEFAAEETLAHAVDKHAARILITKNCGHNRILAKKQVFTEIIDFLKY